MHSFFGGHPFVVHWSRFTPPSDIRMKGKFFCDLHVAECLMESILKSEHAVFNYRGTSLLLWNKISLFKIFHLFTTLSHRILKMIRPVDEKNL